MSIDGQLVVNVDGVCNVPKHAQTICVIDDVFVCAETGSVHVCDGACTAEKYTNCRKNQVCTISGLETRSKIYVDACVKQKRRKRLRPWNNNMAATETIQKLLFSTKRIQLERSKVMDAHAHARSVCITYIKRTRIPCLTDLVALYSSRICTVVYSRTYLQWLHADGQNEKSFEEHYSTIIRKSWMFVVNELKIPTIRWADFVIVILYIFRNGFSYMRKCVIPRDYVLYKILPLACHLDKFDINKRSFTNTKNITIEYIRKACASGKLLNIRRSFEEIIEN